MAIACWWSAPVLALSMCPFPRARTRPLGAGRFPSARLPAPLNRLFVRIIPFLNLATFTIRLVHTFISMMRQPTGVRCLVLPPLSTRYFARTALLEEANPTAHPYPSHWRILCGGIKCPGSLIQLVMPF